MSIAVGDTLPEGQFIVMGDEGPTALSTADLLGSGKTVIFGLPGAYTGTCTTAHVPSFIRVADDLAAKGVTGIACLSVNDPFVMAAWGDATGATTAGIKMLADADGSFVEALGLQFSAPPVGLINRSKRFSMVVEGGKVTHLNVDENPGVCETSAGEALLEAL